MDPIHDRRNPDGDSTTAVPADRERQVTMLNRKAVVVLASIGAMTVMVVSFAFNTPRRSAAAEYEDLIPAEQVGGNAARHNYLASPPDTSHAGAPDVVSVTPSAPTALPADGAVDASMDLAGAGVAMAGDLDPYAGSAYPAYAAPAQAALAEPRQPSAREMAFQRAMRCGIRSCPAEAADAPAHAAAEWGSWGSAGDGEVAGEVVMQQARAFTAGAGPGGAGTATAARDRHEAFLRSAGGGDNGPMIASRVQRPVSPYQIMAGTLIPVTLVTALNSDLPGEVVAQVTRNVYDTQQRYLLIPAGSKVLGRVDNQVGLGQARVNIAWHRIIFPNNNSFTLPGFGGVDGQGAAGIRDRVNNHYGRTYLNAILLSAITAGAQLSQPQQANLYAAPSAGQIAAGALGQQMGEVSSEMIRRNMQVGPTLQVRPGLRFSIFVSRDLVLEPYEHRGDR